MYFHIISPFPFQNDVYFEIEPVFTRVGTKQPRGWVQFTEQVEASPCSATLGKISSMQLCLPLDKEKHKQGEPWITFSKDTSSEHTFLATVLWIQSEELDVQFCPRLVCWHLSQKPAPASLELGSDATSPVRSLCSRALPSAPLEYLSAVNLVARTSLHYALRPWVLLTLVSPDPPPVRHPANGC